MRPLLTDDQIRNLASRGFSRRNFGRIAAMLSAGAALPLTTEPALAQLSRIRGAIPADAVKIDANENPLGPCKEALAAIQGVLSQGGRYVYDETDKFIDILAEQEGLKPSYIRAYAGSSAPLTQSVIAFTGPDKPLVMADPGYEAAGNAARFIGAKTINVKLDKSYAHDVRAMAAASPNAGLIYIVNPNNPTGTATTRADIEWLVENKPKGSIILLDEAYIHLSGDKVGSDFVAADKDVIILRTFSKIYGMAGIRAGAAMGRPDLLNKIGGYSSGAMPITGMAAAAASLKSKTLVPERRKMIAAVRNDVFSFMDKHKFSYVPSVSNCFMVDVKRPGQQIREAMVKEKVYVGRVWPSWPNHVRVTIGTQEEMDKFKAAFLKVMA